MFGKKTINLALQGGGSHGAFTWGVLSRLNEENNLQIEGISGTSSGAMNASLYTSGLLSYKNKSDAIQPLNAFWHDLGDVFTQIFTPANNLVDFPFLQNSNNNPFLRYFMGMTQGFSPYVFNPSNLDPLRELVEKHVKFNKFHQRSRQKLYVAATNVKNSKLKIFEREEITADHLLASACLPAIHHAVEINGETYWDGGFSGNPVISPLIFGCKAKDILIVLVNPLEIEQVPKSAESISERISEIAFNANFMREMRAITLSKRYIKKQAFIPRFRGSLEKKLDNVRLHIIQATDCLSNIEDKSKHDASPALLNELYESGYNCADRWIQTNMSYVGKESSIDLSLFE